jgi:hypothetical protein
MTLERQPLETVTQFTMRRIRAEIIEECARLVDKIGDDSYYEKDRNNATYIASELRRLVRDKDQ